MRCMRCHRPLKRPTESGMGRVCAKLAPPVPQVERDLFGYDIERAAHAALERLVRDNEWAAFDQHMSNRAMFRAARVRMGVLAE